MSHPLQFNSTGRGARAHRLSGYFTVLAILLTLIAPSAFAQVVHNPNPYAGANPFVNPYFAQEVAAAAAAQPAGSAIQKQMYTIQGQPTAVWVTSLASIPGLAPR